MISAASGRTALSAIIANETLFPRVKDTDLAAAARKLTRKQIIAAGLTRDDLLAIKTAIGADVFDGALHELSPHHIKLLAKRLDPTAPEIEVNTGSSALAHIQQTLSDHAPNEPSTPAEPDSAPTQKNKYLGRKAFRTGR
ncbi:MAG: hypothetical protein AAGH49_05280 [Pseudomonadota bacterium]